MEPKTPKKKPGPTKEYTEALTLYDSEEGMELLKEVAKRRGMSRAAVLRDLLRQEATRLGVQPA